MSEIKPTNTFKLNVSKELSEESAISAWDMLNRLENQVNHHLGRNNWYAVRYYSHKESDGSLTFLIDVVEHKIS